MDNLMWIIYALIGVIMLVLVLGLAKIFTKAGYSAWMAFIPFLNYFVMVKIAKQSQWFFWLSFLPLIGLITSGVVLMSIARNFGKGTVFAVITMFFSWITIPIMGFDDSVYKPVE